MKAIDAVQELCMTLEEYVRRGHRTELIKKHVSRSKSTYYVIHGARSVGKRALKIRISDHDASPEKNEFMRLNKIHDFTIIGNKITEEEMCENLAAMLNLLDMC